jgi:hypothetical protein
MQGKFTHIFMFFILLLTATVTSCRKDEDMKANIDNVEADTAVSSSAGSFLATSGNLKVSFEDSTYTFDATKDSIAFIRVDTAGNQYFGVTAINKEHTVSFGISGLGVAASKAVTKIAGSQFLAKAKNKPKVEYTLSQATHELELGKLSLKKYNDDAESVLAKGTFSTFLAKDTIQGAPVYKVTGSFDLKLD